MPGEQLIFFLATAAAILGLGLGLGLGLELGGDSCPMNQSQNVMAQAIIDISHFTVVHHSLCFHLLRVTWGSKAL